MNATDWETFTPRRQLASAPYALRSGNVAGGADIQANTLVTTGSVGIGTTSPAAMLEISGVLPRLRLTHAPSGGYTTFEQGNGYFNIGLHSNQFSISSGYGLSIDPTGDFRLGDSGGDGNGTRLIVNDAAQYISLTTAGEDRVHVDAGGSVGIGTTAPSQLLTVADALGGDINLNRSDTEINTGGLLGAISFSGMDPTEQVGAKIEARARGSWSADNAPSSLHFCTTSAGSATPEEAMIINWNGCVGIGTTYPSSYKLHVEGDSDCAIYGNSTGTYGIRGETSRTSCAGVIGKANDSSSWGVYGYNPHGGVAVRGWSSGWGGYFVGSVHVSEKIGIGTTSPSAPLEVGDAFTDGEILVTSSDGRQAVLEADDGGNNIHVGSVSNHNFSIVANDVRRISISSGDAIRFYDDTGNDEEMRIETSGRVGIGTTNPTHLLHVAGAARSTQSSWETSSDIRLKDIVGQYEYGIDEIRRINPVRFTYKADNPLALPADTEFVGVIAQEIRDVIPEAVEKAGDGYLTVQNDPVFWAVVNAVKELKVENEALRMENKVIKGDNEELKEEINNIKQLLGM